MAQRLSFEERGAYRELARSGGVSGSSFNLTIGLSACSA